jgi:hypothetical protein
MGKEAGWLAGFLCVVLVAMMVVMPHGGRGKLPEISDLERRPAVSGSDLPLVGPLVRQMTEAIEATTTSLELLPY